MSNKLDEITAEAKHYILQVTGAQPGATDVQRTIAKFIERAYLAGLNAERNRNLKK
jgi:hypothetical protein